MQRIKKIQLLCCTLLIITVMTLNSCYYDKEELLYPDSTQAVDCATISAKFSIDVQPIILNKCAIPGCHDAGSASGGIVFQNYSQISSTKDRIYQRAIVEKSMPPTGPLLPAEIAKIKCWIEAGAPNN